MPLPKAKILAATASLLRNNDWAFSQTLAPKAGSGMLSDILKARINASELPKIEPSPVTASIAGYEITQAGRHKTGGEITIQIFEAADGQSSAYFEALKGLNNPRNSAGQLTGVGVPEADKEGEYTFSLLGVDNTVVKKYTIKQAVVMDVVSSELAPGEEAEFVSFTVSFQFKDHTIKGANGQILA
jgi:hypothetical protein